MHALFRREKSRQRDCNKSSFDQRQVSNHRVETVIECSRDRALHIAKLSGKACHRMLHALPHLGPTQRAAIAAINRNVSRSRFRIMTQRISQSGHAQRLKSRSAKRDSRS
jgi:hypothetical protein